MNQTKKGKERHFGMKAHVGVDADLGLIPSLVRMHSLRSRRSRGKPLSQLFRRPSRYLDDLMPLPNASTTLSREVNVTDLASSYADSPGESYPDVLCSPAMLSLMERACADLLKGETVPGHLSVGVSTKFDHLAPTALGETIAATATFSRQDGRLFWFDVSVSDSSGIVGRGSHARALVSRETIEQAARKRAHR